jgi:3-phenylpropionate/trans-cinnamate dioxygenase ferredoxin reductase subunit
MTATCVVVGGGLAGATTAFTLRAGGFEGRIVVVCEEQRPPYSKPQLSKGVLRRELADQKTNLRPSDWYGMQEVELLLGRPATGLDVPAREVELSDGERLRYDHLVLATGGRARSLPGADGVPGVLSLRTLDEAHTLRERLGPRRSLLVVGGGFIGAEVAASARQTGTNVTVLEAESAPMSRLLPPVLSETCARLHRDRGVDLRVGTGVVHLEAHGEEVLAVDTRGEHHRADTVLVAIGITPATALAEKAGLAVDNGITVDEYCRTSAPDVYAVGDVANHPNPLLGRRVRIEHWQNAQHQAAAAARTILGRGAPFAEIPWVWSDQYEVNLQIAGLPQPTDEVVLRGDVGSLDFSAFLIRDGLLAATVGVNRAGDVRAGRRLIGHGYRPVPSLLRDEGVDLEALAADVAVPA